GESFFEESVELLPYQPVQAPQHHPELATPSLVYVSPRGPFDSVCMYLLVDLLIRFVFIFPAVNP
ncbi:hypothetical protein P3656_24305, partial [Vibrio parahaemolyticus]|uniref:hypothetical protein n=1 Tax=Vibrio parahaemolyticus TaxID=670 RepID=UPI00201E7237